MSTRRENREIRELSGNFPCQGISQGNVRELVSVREFITNSGLACFNFVIVIIKISVIVCSFILIFKMSLLTT